MISGWRRASGRGWPAPAWMTVALAAGFGAGLVVGPERAGPVGTAQLIGGLWLDGLRMTVVPLVFALVVTGVAGLRTEAGRIGGRLLSAMAAFLLLSAAVVVVVVPPLLNGTALPAGTLGAVRDGAAPQSAVVVPGMAEALHALMPVNIVASAAAGAMVPLVLFALVFGAALGRIDPVRASAALAPLQGLADAMVIVIGWVLRLAPLGVFGLSFAMGATAGGGAVAMLGRYLLVSLAVSLILTAACYVAARVGGGVPVWRFARAVAPAQAIAASTQSSLATLPAMLASTAELGLPDDDAGVVLPMAVAVFKVTAPSNALLLGLAMAWMAGVPVSPAKLMLAVPLSLVSTFAVLGMPGAVSLFAATTPTALALGAPLELLPVLLAVDTIPDIARTVTNVTADLAVAAIVARRPEPRPVPPPQA